MNWLKWYSISRLAVCTSSSAITNNICHSVPCHSQVAFLAYDFSTEEADQSSGSSLLLWWSELEAYQPSIMVWSSAWLTGSLEKQGDGVGWWATSSMNDWENLATIMHCSSMRSVDRVPLESSLTSQVHQQNNLFRLQSPQGASLCKSLHSLYRHCGCVSQTHSVQKAYEGV